MFAVNPLCASRRVSQNQRQWMRHLRSHILSIQSYPICPSVRMPWMRRYSTTQWNISSLSSRRFVHDPCHLQSCFLTTTVGETSGVDCRKALSTIPSVRRCPAVARHCVLSFTPSIQVWTFCQETCRRFTVLPRQTPWRDCVCSLPRNPHQGSSKQVLE